MIKWLKISLPRIVPGPSGEQVPDAQLLEAEEGVVLPELLALQRHGDLSSFLCVCAFLDLGWACSSSPVMQPVPRAAAIPQRKRLPR